MHLQSCRACLTEEWPSHLAVSSQSHLEQWHFIFEWLELDRKAVLDMFLLCHSGLVSRSEANRILWELLSKWALKDTYLDLSRKVWCLVWEARRGFERPPWANIDCSWWVLRCYTEPRHPEWSPLEVKTDSRGKYLKTFLDGNGLPQPPPACWSPPAAAP